MHVTVPSSPGSTLYSPSIFFRSSVFDCLCYITSPETTRSEITGAIRTRKTGTRGGQTTRTGHPTVQLCVRNVSRAHGRPRDVECKYSEPETLQYM